jgi:anthranilate/para-aminobenzoate synthase component I
MATQELELPVTPSELVRRCAHEPFLCALDGGGPQSWGFGRALLGFRPHASLRVAANGDAVMQDGHAHRWQGHPFDLLDRFCTATAARRGAAPEPFGGGVVAALSYDLRHWVERLPARARDDLGLPVLHAAAYDWWLSYVYAEQRYRLASVQRSAAELREVAAHLVALATQPVPTGAPRSAACATTDVTQSDYLAAVRTTLDYIAAGDVYQVNLAHRFSVTNPPAPAALFAALQRQHPMPFAAYVDGGDFALISNSPECLITLAGEAVATFPIKGTRPRGTDIGADQALATELRIDPKERAEHVMIVDLERNDLGRVCRPGTVRVDEFARVHSFPSLHHLVSTVSGQLTPGTGLADVLRATFPGGSITGAPKIRAMEIIDALEPVCRGFYTGAIGFIGDDGRAVFNLAIRTAVATPNRLTYHAGGGIVADSLPGREYDETLLKTQAFLAALTAAE